MVDKEYYNDMLLASEEYLELVEKYGTRDLGMIAQIIIKKEILKNVSLFLNFFICTSFYITRGIRGQKTLYLIVLLLIIYSITENSR